MSDQSRREHIAQARADLRQASNAGIDLGALFAWVDGTTRAERVNAAGDAAERERLWQRVNAALPDLVCWEADRDNCMGPVRLWPWDGSTVPSCVEHAPEDDYR